MNPLAIVPPGWLTNSSGIALVFFGALFVAWNGAAQMYPANVPACPSMLADAALPMIGMGLVALGLRREQSANSKKLDVLDAKVSITDPNAAAIAEAEAGETTGGKERSRAELVMDLVRLADEINSRDLDVGLQKLARAELVMDLVRLADEINSRDLDVGLQKLVAVLLVPKDDLLKEPKA